MLGSEEKAVCTTAYDLNFDGRGRRGRGGVVLRREGDGEDLELLEPRGVVEVDAHRQPHRSTPVRGAHNDQRASVQPLHGVRLSCARSSLRGRAFWLDLLPRGTSQRASDFPTPAGNACSAEKAVCTAVRGPLWQ